MGEDLLTKYESEVERLHRLQLSLDVEQRQLKWILVGGGAAALVASIASRPTHGAVIAAFAVVIWGTGLYLTLVHKTERAFNLERAEQELARLREEAKGGDGRPEPPV